MNQSQNYYQPSISPEISNSGPMIEVAWEVVKPDR